MSVVILHNFISVLDCVKAEKEALKKVPPSDLFRQETDKYSKFDEKVNKIFVLYMLTEFSFYP